MNKIKQLSKAKELLEQANIIASKNLANNKEVQEARFHIKKAINNIEEASKSHESRKKTNSGQFEQWWGSVQSGVANSSISGMSQKSQAKSLSILEKMIDDEQKKIDDLETKAQIRGLNDKQSDNEFFSD
jgi:predicted ATPase